MGRRYVKDKKDNLERIPIREVFINVDMIISAFESNSDVKKAFPNTTLTTRENISTKLKVGQTITGNTSGATGTIVRRNHDLGQIIVEGTVNFSSGGETITSLNPDGNYEFASVISTSTEYQSASYYTDTTGVVDLGVDSSGNLLAAGATKNEITHEQAYYDVNESLRQIKVIRPSLITSLVGSYKKALRTDQS